MYNHHLYPTLLYQRQDQDSFCQNYNMSFQHLELEHLFEV